MTFILSPWDYVIIVIFLCISASIGIFYAFGRNRQRSAAEYFLANHQMSVLPVSLSLVVSTLSAVTYLGTPSEIYIHGVGYWITITQPLVCCVLICIFILPVFYHLEITSVYEYIDRRFNRIVRYGVIVSEVLYTFMYMGIVLFTPALALSTVTSLDLRTSILVLGFVCTFYTTIGGIKAVIWTDALQAVLMMCGMIIMIITCCIRVGGIEEIWRRATMADRTQYLDLKFDITIITGRYSFFGIFFGSIVYILANFGSKQTFIQRYKSCSSFRDAQIAAVSGVVGIALFTGTAVLLGMCMFGYFAYCDPLNNNDISRTDQLVPYLIVSLFEGVPGLPGLLIVGAFSAALSSVSSLVNALAAITGEDIIKVIWKDIPETKYTRIVKILSAFFGLLSIAVAFLASTLGTVVKETFSFAGIFGAPVLGIFLLGIFVPFANDVGAIVGLFTSILVGFGIKIGSYFSEVYVYLPPRSTSECLNSSVEAMPLPTSEEKSTTINHELEDVSSLTLLAAIFHIGYFQQLVLGFILTFGIGIMVSLVTKKYSQPKSDPTLITPCLRRFCKPYNVQSSTDIELSKGNMNTDEH